MRMLKLILCVVVCLLLSFSCVNISFAASESQDEIMKELQLLKERIAQLENKLAEQSKEIKEEKVEIAKQEQTIAAVKSEFEESYDYMLLGDDKKPTFAWHGLRIGLQGTFIGQGTNNANLLGSDKEDKFEGSCQLDLEFEKKFSSISGRGYANIRAGEGQGADRVMVLYSKVDNNAADDKHLWFTQLFYEQYLFDNKAIFHVGKIDPTVFFDLNRLAGSDSTAFLGSIFNNNPVIEFPDPNLAVRVGFTPIDSLEVTFMAQNANPDWNEIDNNLFNMAQLVVKPQFFDKEGYYRFMAWYNNVEHLKWSNGATRGTYGLALSFDQDITDVISLFTRYGWEDPKVYNPNVTATGDNVLSLEQSWSAGFQLTGELWGRKQDFCGLAVGQVIPSDDYKKALSRKGKSEGHLELYYTVNLNDHFSFGPGFQYIWNPYGKDITNNTDSAFVYDIRTHVDF